MKKSMYFMMALGLAGVSGRLFADCYYYLMDKKDGCTASACRNGQCQCTWFYHEYLEGSNSTSCTTSHNPTSLGGSEKKVCTHWKLTKDEAGKDVAQKGTTQKVAGFTVDLEKAEIVATDKHERALRLPTCKNCGHPAHKHIHKKPK